jgi:hypothetical protein
MMGWAGGGTWQTAPIEVVAQYNPQLALIRAWRVPMAPWILNVRATFTDPSVTVIPTVSLENGQGRLQQVSVVDKLDFTIDQPAAFAGNIFKPQSDFYAQGMLGLQAKLNVDGAPRYAVAPFFTPLGALSTFVKSESWPMGWVLTYTQTIVMDFQATIPLPSLPLTVTASLKMWQPVGTDEFVNMNNSTAFAELRKIYKDNSDVIAALDVAQNSGISR